MSLNLDEWRALSRIFLKDAPTTQVHTRIDTTHGLLRACDLHQEDGFLKCRISEHLGSEATTASRRHDLACALISLIYCTPVVTSTTILAPSVSGPQHQIFLASMSSKPCFSLYSFVRSFGSAFGPAFPSSMSLQSSSVILWAVK